MKQSAILIGCLVAVLAAGTEARAQMRSQTSAPKNDLYTDLFFISSKAAGGEDITRVEWQSSYGRLLTSRIAVGPVLGVFKNPGGETYGYAGGLVRYHFADQTSHLIPYVEVNGSRNFNPSTLTDVQVEAGLLLPMGRTGGRIRVAPYYYQSFGDANDFRSFGLKWGVGLLF